MERTLGSGGGLIKRGEALLIFIDLQEKLMPAVAESALVTENAVKLAAFARIARIPKVVTEQEKLGSTVAVLTKELMDYEALRKMHFNCFLADGFRQAVEGTKRKTLILCGAEAHICIAQTAIFALTDYSVHVVADAVSSRAPSNKAVALERMRQAGAVVTSTEMFIYEMLERAGTEEFKEALKLVK